MCCDISCAFRHMQSALLEGCCWGSTKVLDERSFVGYIVGCSSVRSREASRKAIKTPGLLMKVTPHYFFIFDLLGHVCSSNSSVNLLLYISFKRSHTVVIVRMFGFWHSCRYQSRFIFRRRHFSDRTGRRESSLLSARMRSIAAILHLYGENHVPVPITERIHSAMPRFR